VRYSEALSRGTQQQQIMDEIMQINNIAEIWNSDVVENILLEKINQLN